MGRVDRDFQPKGGFGFDLRCRNEMLVKKGVQLPAFRMEPSLVVLSFRMVSFQELILEQLKGILSLTRAVRKFTIWHQIYTAVVLELLLIRRNAALPVSFFVVLFTYINILRKGEKEKKDCTEIKFLVDIVSSELQLHQYAAGRESRVITALTLLKSHLFSYQSYVGVALVLGGVDITGLYLHTVYPHGSTDNLPFATMGSGSLAAMAVFESKYREGLAKDEGISLSREAICSGIFNDLGSGSNM